MYMDRDLRGATSDKGHYGPKQQTGRVLGRCGVAVVGWGGTCSGATERELVMGWDLSSKRRCDGIDVFMDATDKNTIAMISSVHF